MKKIIISIAVLLMLIPLLSYSAHSAGTCGSANDGAGSTHCTGTQPWTADSASYNDVQYCIETCASDGETINVPSGSKTWSTEIGITDNKKLSIIGAGIGSTVIALPSNAGFDLNGSGSRITGFEFNASSTGVIGRVYGSSWRIDNCEFDYRPAGSKGNAIEADGRNQYYPTWSLSGLIDNCTFYDGRIVVTGSAVTGVSDPTKAYALMAQPADLGGSSAVYIEDCTFELNKFGNLIDANYGGAYVFRFNSVTKGNYTGYVVEAHSLQSTSRGTRKWEIYGNTFIGDGGPYAPFLLRGGIGIIFNNDLKGTWDSENIRIDNRRSTEDLGPGLCDGNTSWDGNIVGKSGLLCRDQIGTGPDSSIWTATPPYPSQPQMPMYSWGNDEVDDSILSVVVSSGSETHIQANRDYYEETAGFDGTSGVGMGVLASIPGTCTTGVGYWATDQGNWNQSGRGGQGVLYKCTSTNTWEKYYTPYEYPHPLRDQSPAISPLSAPQDLKIIQ